MQNFNRRLEDRFLARDLRRRLLRREKFDAVRNFTETVCYGNRHCANCGNHGAGAFTGAGSPLKFTSFNVPGSAGGSLSVEGVNDEGEIVAGYTIASGTFGFRRSPGGTLAPVADPLNTGSFTYTRADGVNNRGTITGLFFNTAANEFDGFEDKRGTFTTYVFPGLPAGSETALEQAKGEALCGFVIQNTPPFNVPPVQSQGFVSLRNGAKTEIFSVKNSVQTFCEDINDFNIAAGSYQDSAGVWHGFTRTTDGTITTIDAPGASTTPGSEPCPVQDGQGGTTVAGTLVHGINKFGDISGHFFDTSYNEHGFVLSHTGKFTQIDFPGGFQTGGGKLNDFGEVVGHYTNASCNAFGYIAQLR
jgi:hypothetical protein